jgi:hypothetical protein
MCDCLGLRHVSHLLNVSVQLLMDLAHAGHLDYHVHDSRMAITRAGIDDMRWKMAVAKSEKAA